MGRYKLSKTSDGNKTLIYTDTNEIRLHSAYNPIKEAQRATDSFKKGKANVIIVCGMGLAYHIQLLKKKFPACTIMVIERDSEVVRISQDTYPQHLEHVPVITTGSDLSSIFEAMDMSTFNGAAYYFHRPSYMIDKTFYDNIIKDINQYISSKLSDLLTRFEFEERWIENILANLHMVFQTAPVSNLFGKFAGYPGIIVSAGPSLRRNIHLLSHLKDRALIVSVDTALKVLQKNNINPHLIMTLDSQKHSLKHFLGLRNQEPALIADMVSSPKVVDHYRGKLFMSTTSKYYTDSKGNLKRETIPLIEWIEKYIDPLGDIQSGGSVATSIFDLLLNLGCNPIILIGQDLAYTGREIHCSGTHHNEEWIPGINRFSNLDTINQNIIRKRMIKYVEAYGGHEKVISDFVFDLYKTWFSDSVKKVSVRVFNATEGGARIDNTIESSMSAIIQSLTAPLEQPDKVLSKAFSCTDPVNANNLYEGVASAIEETRKIKENSEQYLKNIESADQKDIDRLLKGENASKLIIPFLRKTYIYLARHDDLDPQRALSMILTDIVGASIRAIKLLTKCKENLDNIR
jgi:hypothetical protein